MVVVVEAEEVAEEQLLRFCGEGANENTSSVVCADFSLSMTAVSEPLTFFTCDGEDLSVVITKPLPSMHPPLPADCWSAASATTGGGGGVCLGEVAAADFSADMLGFPPVVRRTPPACLGDEMLCFGLVMCFGLAECTGECFGDCFVR